MAINYNGKGNLKRIYYNNNPVYRIRRKSDNKIMWNKPYSLTGLPGEDVIETPDSIPTMFNYKSTTNRNMMGFQAKASTVGYTGQIALNWDKWKIFFALWFVDSFDIRDTWQENNANYNHVHLVMDGPNDGNASIFASWF